MKTPFQIVELRQPRCALRFGVGACTATGTPKCYNTWATCKAKTAFDGTGQMRWRFVKNSPGLRAFGEFTDPDDTATNGIPVNNLSVSVSKSQLNVSGILSGKSPFGIQSTCTISMDDFVWDDPWGDFYLADRVDMPRRFFWECFLARNALFSNMEIVVYDGYEGDDLADMRQRLYILDSIDGPDGGSVTLNGVSPLMLADSKRALFPPAYSISLVTAITATATSFDVYTDAESNISGIIGLTSRRFVLIGSEVIEYTGYTVVTAGQYTLTGCIRAHGGTTASRASLGAKVGRVGHFANALLVDAAEYLLGTWTPMGAARIDSAGWHEERDSYLATSRCETYITSPTAVVDLVGELCQQGTFMIWWDEYAQKVQLQGIRPPNATVPTLDDATGILQASLTMDPDARLTRILVYYGPRDITKNTAENFETIRGQIEGDGELPEAGGEARTLQILGRWVTTEAQAYQVIFRTFLRYKAIPKMLSVRIDSKDRNLAIGQPVDVITRAVRDSEGRAVQKRWQVTSWTELIPGQTYQIDLQDYGFEGRFAWIMPDGTPDYASASDAEKEHGWFFPDNDGLLPDGSPGYLFQ
jgi:hypothetical protein